MAPRVKCGIASGQQKVTRTVLAPSLVMESDMLELDRQPDRYESFDGTYCKAKPHLTNVLVGTLNDGAHE